MAREVAERLVTVMRHQRHVSVRVDDESCVRERSVRVDAVRLRREVHLLILHLAYNQTVYVLSRYGTGDEPVVFLSQEVHLQAGVAPHVNRKLQKYLKNSSDVKRVWHWG